MILRSDLKSREGAWWLIIHAHKFEQKISFSIIPSWFLKSLLPLIRNLFCNNFCGAIFKVRHCLTWEKVTDSRCWYSKPRGLYDWNPPPTKSSFYIKKKCSVNPQTRKKVHTVPKGSSFPITLSSCRSPQHLKTWYLPEVPGRVCSLQHLLKG